MKRKLEKMITQNVRNNLTTNKPPCCLLGPKNTDRRERFALENDEQKNSGGFLQKQSEAIAQIGVIIIASVHDFQRPAHEPFFHYRRCKLLWQHSSHGCDSFRT